MIEPGSPTRYRSLRDPATRDAARFGERAARLATLAGLGLPVPRGLALPVDMVADLAREGGARVLGPGLEGIAGRFGPGTLFAVRGSPPRTDWGGPPAILNIGITRDAQPALAARIGRAAALDLHRRLVQSFAVAVAGLEAEAFEELADAALVRAGAVTEAELGPEAQAALLADSLALYAGETGEPFPETVAAQLRLALEAAARGWARPSARLLREARGAPAEAGLGLLVQVMVPVPGRGFTALGTAQFTDERTGAPGLHGSWRPVPAAAGSRPPRALGPGPGSLAEGCPGAHAALVAAGAQVARALGEAMALDFAVEDGALAILDAAPARRSGPAAARIAVDLAEAGAISREQAILRVEPRSLSEQLHATVDPDHPRDVLGRGLAASPGAASGRIAMSAEAAMAMASQEERPILVRVETSPEDIRGMHAAAGLLTVRGGMSSHAAVIARGLGLPCIVGCGEVRLDLAARRLRAADGRVLAEGDTVTVDGSAGELLAGAAPMREPGLSGAFARLLDWADGFRRLRVRANADTPQDARTARRFGAEGIGLCRTEQMFFEAERINVMREMILAATEAERRHALDRLLPMQRSDFVELFEIMAGLPVTIRLLDPPLHEFLPQGREEIAALAAEMGLPEAQVRGRAEELQEFNPMLGMRGVRLAVTMPEIYEMQARAIFEATLIVRARDGVTVTPEIMIPLVSAAREVELVKARVEAVAAAVEREREAALSYRIGVMVETPRAALRAGDLARSSAFFSFGTNDLTQMTYGLSRDDAGRFMRDYVNQGVFPEDPFRTLDLAGVGELLRIAAERGRAANPALLVGICGEHGGDPASIRFCEAARFDYISCSPYRTPIARLAAAQAALGSASP